MQELNFKFEIKSAELQFLLFVCNKCKSFIYDENDLHSIEITDESFSELILVFNINGLGGRDKGCD